MKIRLLSDLHIEFYGQAPYPYTYYGEDVLVLAGDIGVGVKGVLNALNGFVNMGVPHIIYITGNHEYYGQDFDNINKTLAHELSGDSKISFMQRDTVTIDDVTFIGATLWTNFNNEDYYAMHSAEAGISDFSLIRRNGNKFKPADAVGEYRSDIAYIRNQYENIEGKKMVITHFLPAKECIHPRYRGVNVLNHYFANDLGDYISYMTDTTWVFGHTHDTIDINLGDTRVVCNPRGYYPHDLNTNYQDDFIIEI